MSKARLLSFIVSVSFLLILSFIRSDFVKSLAFGQASLSEKVSGTQSVKHEQVTKKPIKVVSGEVLFQMGQYKYQESKMSIDGPLYGVAGNLFASINDSLKLGGRAEYMSGKTIYSGRYLDPEETPVSAPSDDRYYDIAGLGQFLLSKN